MAKSILQQNFDDLSPEMQALYAEDWFKDHPGIEEIEETESGHSRRSPSDAGRWMDCLGAINLTEDMVETRSSFPAAEGTFAHSIREDSLELGFDPHDFIGTKGLVDGFPFECTEEMADFLQPGIDRIREFKGLMTVEYRVNLGRWMPKQGGTLDLGICGEDMIYISDLKYGAGIPVSPVRNKQQMIYALGFWWNVARHVTRANRFKIIIDQPRHHQGGGEWDVGLEELLRFGEEVKAAVIAGERPDAPRTPSEYACMWCPAAAVAGKCREFETWQLENLCLELEDLDEAVETGGQIIMPSTGLITPERRSAIIRSKDSIKKWLTALWNEAVTDYMDGKPVPMLKVVEGKLGNRKFANMDEARAWAEPLVPHEKLFIEKMASPAQIETVLGKGKIPGDLIVRSPGKPVLVPMEDSRLPMLSFPDMVDGLEDLD